MGISLPSLPLCLSNNINEQKEHEYIQPCLFEVLFVFKQFKDDFFMHHCMFYLIDVKCSPEVRLREVGFLNQDPTMIQILLL